MWRRRVAVCAIGAAVAAFPAGLALGIAGTMAGSAAQRQPAVQQAAHVETQPASMTAAQHEALAVQAARDRDDYINAFALADRCIQVMRSMRPDGLRRSVEVIEADRKRRASRERLLRQGASQ